jgi:hypothetical protein
MSAPKMLVVILSKTHAVLGVATRRAGGVPAVDVLAGGGLLARRRDSADGVTIPPDELAVKEVDYIDDAFRDPHAYAVDASGTVAVPSNRVNSITGSATKVTVGLLHPAAAADKDVVVFIDGGPNNAPLKFVGKTALSASTVDVQVSGVPTGSRLVLASVDGCDVRLESETF